MLAITLLTLPSFAGGSMPSPTPEEAAPPIAVTVNTDTDRRDYTARPPRLFHGHTAAWWAARYRRRSRQLYVARVQLRHHWKPTVDYALRLASAVTGVSYWSLRSVSYCESTHNPFATNGRYLGLFQLSWSPFGLSPFDPIANALSAAMTVRHDGSWRQWECKP